MVVVVALVGAVVERVERLLDSKVDEEVVVAAVVAVVLDEALMEFAVMLAEGEEKTDCFSSDLLVSLVLCWESE